MSSLKLLPCPFCGRKAELRYDKDGFAYILCANDGCYVRTDGCLNENEAARLWNTRKPIKKVIDKLYNLYPINPYPNEFTNGRNLGNQNAIRIIEEECLPSKEIV